MNFNAEIEIDLNKLKYNVTTLKDTYGDYSVAFANVKNNAFGMGYGIIETLTQNGINYLYVSTLNEALEIRKINTEVPILIGFELSDEYIYDAITNNLTITVSNLNNLVAINEMKLKDKLNIHLLIDNGSNKLGLKNKEELSEAISIIKSNKYLMLEGVYTELPSYGVIDEYYYKQMNNFSNIIENINQENLIIHLNEPIMYHKKSSLVNGIRFDLSLLGIEENIDDRLLSNLKIKNIEKKYNNLAFPNITLSLIFSLKARITSLSKATKGTLIGRNYLAKEDLNLAIVPIGHKDGITKALTKVVVNDKICQIVTDEIDHLIVAVPSETCVGDIVYLLNEEIDIYDVIGSLKTNRFYLMSILNNNLKREYINLEEGDNIL